MLTAAPFLALLKEQSAGRNRLLVLGSSLSQGLSAADVDDVTAGWAFEISHGTERVARRERGVMMKTACSIRMSHEVFVQRDAWEEGCVAVPCK